MNEYTASNGVTIRRTRHGYLSFSNLDLGALTGITLDEEAALREFFQHERDEELGRWRWPENPDFVVYPRGVAGIRVSSESSGDHILAVREAAMNWALGEPTFFGAARAYFEAHPERKPWHDAKPGEVWAFVSFGEELAATVTSDGRFRFGDDSHLKVSDPVITSARRIWPEEA